MVKELCAANIVPDLKAIAKDVADLVDDFNGHYYDEVMATLEEIESRCRQVYTQIEKEMEQ